MLNRRILRGKVMQQIFAYKTCVAANAELSTERIIEKFTPDLNSLDAQDPKKLEGYAKLSIVNFDKFLKTGESDVADSLPEEVKKEIKAALLFYKSSNSTDQIHIFKRMVEDCEKLFDDYLLNLMLITILADKLAEIKKSSKLQSNKIINGIKNHTFFNKETGRKSLTWANDEDLVSDLMTALLADDEFKAYLKKTETQFEEDKAIVAHIVKQIFFKSPKFNDFFESRNLNWQEDKVAVKDMIVDCIKSMNENEEFALSSISKNWDDDKEFMKTLFTKTIENDSVYEGYISPKLQNWDISRLTATDSILLKLCISEMINFFNIPVKVSMNEYIEISKRYSTPKSKTLINGVLDALAIELQKSGVIKKSGRGLIDNK